MQLTRLPQALVEKSKFLVIYPLILLVGISVNCLLPNSVIEQYQKIYWFSSRNIINHVFAYHGNDIFRHVFGFLMVGKLLYREEATQAVEEPNFKKWVWELTIKYSCKDMGLMLLFLAFDQLFLYTGGSCQIDIGRVTRMASEAKTAGQCRSAIKGQWRDGICAAVPGRLLGISQAQECRTVGSWEGGFDVSGHFCFLVTLSLIFWFEMERFYNVPPLQVDIEKQNPPNHQLAKLRAACPIILLAFICVWANVLLVTATFYHSPAEKMLGLASGYVIPWIMYRVIPRYSNIYSS